MSSQPKFRCVSTFIGPSNLVGRDKNSLLSNDLLQIIDDIRFDYYEPSDNEDDVDNDSMMIFITMLMMKLLLMFRSLV